jgi:hypothetical protein
MSIPLPVFDPILIFSVVAMQVGARYLDLELTEFQKKLLKNKVIQTLILLGLIYVPLRDIKRSIMVLILIYLVIYVLFNENNYYNLFPKKFLYNQGILKNYDDMKKKYYDNYINLFSKKN